MEDLKVPYWQSFDWDGDGDVDADDARVYLSRHLLIRLTDLSKNPLPHAKCRIIGDAETIYECDEEGVAHIPVPKGNPPGIDLEWEPKSAATNDRTNRFYFKNSFNLNVATKNDDECATRLVNLGFTGDTLADKVNAYQNYFGRIPTGILNDICDEMVEWHDGGSRPGGNMGQSVSSTQPAINNVELILLDYGENPMPNAKCRRTDDNETVYTANSNGIVTIPIASGTLAVDVEWEPAIACNVEGSPRFYMKRTVTIDN